MTFLSNPYPTLDPKAAKGSGKRGITSVAELERLGPVVAYRLLKQRLPKASLNLLWAIAAGLKGKDWREHIEAAKKRLRKQAEAKRGRLSSIPFSA